ncbi:MAG: tRNA preQ1(34) S-adenosylmethionine ribosyltransferase-isomerase QueA [Patescibacteria group bacterium]
MPDDILTSYDYALPEELVAQWPASPRDTARLLVYRKTTGDITDTTFSRLGDFLPPHALIVLNDTKVLPARVAFTKSTGGTVALLYISHTDTTSLWWSPKPLKAGDTLSCGSHAITVIERTADGYTCSLPAPAEELFSFLETYGTTPLPPYIKHSPLSESEARAEYQTVFAQEQGSVAAPTASLHFTPELLERIKKEYEVVSVTLHVNRGTFAPVTDTQLAQHTLHSEWYRITQSAADAIRSARDAHRPIIAVGTTAIRVLETIAHYERWEAHTGTTTLFMRPPQSPQLITGCITNFHVPRSSLLMLIASIIGRNELMRIYAHAITERYRFYSFGDAMLILP